VVLPALRGAGAGREQQVEEPQQEAGHGGPEAKLPDDDCDDPTRTTASERRLTISLSLSLGLGLGFRGLGFRVSFLHFSNCSEYCSRVLAVRAPSTAAMKKAAANKRRAGT